VYHKVTSGPLGGDQEIGALVAQDKVAAVFFFRDPLSAHPHDSDINALCRLCDVHNTLVATNRTTGNAMLYSLRHLQCHTALLVPHQEHTESEVIKAYKAKQSRAIADVTLQMNQARSTNPRPQSSGN
jgi:methylglyoxal synthase